MAMSPPRIPIEDRLAKLQDKDSFRIIVEYAFKDACKEGHIKPVFSHALMHDAWESFRWDTKRLDDNMSSKPDHFKICGFAAYWLRRNSPVIGLKKSNTKITRDKQVKELQHLLTKYGRSFLAFHLGYEICHFYERNREEGGLPGSAPRIPDADFVETLCYVMKYKNLSPHAMGMIYRSLFLTTAA